MTPGLLDLYATIATLGYMIPILAIGFVAYCCYAAFNK